ncbi:hypothetical protein JJB09_03160 [Rhizobium sp. KVB221]|uniref:Calcium-binding protein n=1 Tax=Rhizobium setariae TaxID=2801340 RepID=A0A937CNS8_9HYPH|nr:hypothetical protein [Rhizobium setariae]
MIEQADEGEDTVNSTVTYTLGANLDHLVLLGKARINGTGNELDNFMTGNAGNNILKGMDGSDLLTGGRGSDRLFGGAGVDYFAFSKGDGIDTIKDYNDDEDIIAFRVFGGIDDFTDLTIKNKGGDAWINLGGQRIVVEGAAGVLDDGDFAFNF